MLEATPEVLEELGELQEILDQIRDLLEATGASSIDVNEMYLYMTEAIPYIEELLEKANTLSITLEDLGSESEAAATDRD